MTETSSTPKPNYNLLVDRDCAWLDGQCDCKVWYEDCKYLTHTDKSGIIDGDRK